MIVAPEDAATVQVAASVLTAVVVLLGAGATWGSLRTFTKNLDAKITETRATNLRDHEQVRDELREHQDNTRKDVQQIWGKVNEHEGRIGNLEGRARGHHA